MSYAPLKIIFQTAKLLQDNGADPHVDCPSDSGPSATEVFQVEHKKILMMPPYYY